MLTVLALVAWTAVAVCWNLRAENAPPLRLIDRGSRVGVDSQLSAGK